jgi:hypothetical protein
MATLSPNDAVLAELDKVVRDSPTSRAAAKAG